MAKIQFSDVTPPERRSIRNIPIPNSGKRKTAPIVKPVSESNVVIHKRESFDPVKETVDIAKIKNDQAYEYYYPKEERVSDFKKDFSTHSFGGGFQSKKRFVFGGVAILAIIAFIVLMMTVFASATVAITPKSQNLQVDMSLVGTQEFDEQGAPHTFFLGHFKYRDRKIDWRIS
jgi:hypothetical protein